MQIDLSETQTKEVAAIHKEMMIAFATHASKYDNEKSFQMFCVSIAVTISSVLSSLGVKNLDTYLNDMTDIIKKIHNDVKANSCYMEFNNGKKVSEGRFQ